MAKITNEGEPIRYNETGFTQRDPCCVNPVFLLGTPGATPGETFFRLYNGYSDTYTFPLITPFTLFIPAYTRRDMSVVAFIAFDFYPVHPIILKILIQTVFCLFICVNPCSSVVAFWGVSERGSLMNWPERRPVVPRSVDSLRRAYASIRCVWAGQCAGGYSVSG